MDAETASMASTAVCASEQAEAAQKVCAERAVWSCIVVRAIVHASFLLRCSDFSAADGIFQVINFIKLSPGPAKKLGDSAGNRPGSRRGCRAGRRYCSADGFEGGLEVGEDIVDVLGADGQADGIGADALVGELLLGQLASREKIFRLSMNLWASAWPPLISKVKMEPPPFGKYFS